MKKWLTFDELLEYLDQEFIWNYSFLEEIKKNILTDEDFLSELHNDITENVTESIIEKLISGELSPEINTLYRDANAILEAHIKSIIESNRGVRLLLASAFDEESAKKLYNLFEQSAYKGISNSLETDIREKMDDYVAHIISEKNPTINKAIYSNIINGIFDDIIIERTLVDYFSKRIDRYLTSQANALSERMDNRLDNETDKLAQRIESTLTSQCLILGESIETQLTNKASVFSDSLKQDIQSEILGDFSESLRMDIYNSLKRSLEKSIRLAAQQYFDDHFPVSLSQNYSRLKKEISLLNEEVMLLQKKKDSIELTLDRLTKSLVKETADLSSSDIDSKSEIDKTVISHSPRKISAGEIPIEFNGFNTYGYDDYDYGLKMHDCCASLDVAKQTIRVTGEMKVYDFQKLKLNIIWGKKGAKVTFQFEVYDKNNEMIRTSASNVYLDSSDQAKFAFNIYIPIRHYDVEYLKPDITKIVLSLME